MKHHKLTHDKKMPLLHGEAIAIGFICEAYLSFLKNNFSESDLKETVKAIRTVYPTYNLKKESYRALFDVMKNDKKNIAGQISFSLLSEIGKCGFDKFCSEEEIFESLDYYSGM